MIPSARNPLDVDLMAAVHLREALEAAERGDKPKAIGALMSIDAVSWEGIQNRLKMFGGSLPALLASVGGAPL